MFDLLEKIFITDGTICIEKVKINRQSWVYPLIDVDATMLWSGATVEELYIPI
jgi:hypothetical protein